MDVLIVQPQLPSIHLDASTIGRVCFGWDDLGVFGFIRLIRITDDSTLFIESILSGSCDAQYGELGSHIVLTQAWSPFWMSL